MKKGQISLDLMFTVIVVILLAQVFATFTQELSQSERTTGIRAQEQNILNDLTELINQTKIFDENRDSNFNINYRIPFIIDPQKRGKQDCNITLHRSNSPNTYMKISYKSIGLNEVAVKKDINFNFLFKTDLNYICGQMIDANRDNWGET
ncbi:MAG: hypothetical protein COT90_01440 [Candidatus Diapherotrites archaeon CG10_big_fil_rev_8_21_14_0_10_31_34]|nr:MAG: hypothetical protein COT90_01440 [Candidatus Diapherotrites archaeon CG10_big_fil_rev_8_21_14_0_10_31_34]PJA18680.1 MAG: hypothetical protein COX63_02040 [Candidatus Diapherotrites archaeon CG_4_10_14_0_2_um_filter_31_5]